jgi:thiamine biosynthesis lipoprotein
MKEVRSIMGMPVSIEVVGDEAEAMERAFEHLVWVDEKFSTYKPGSQISRLNRGELEQADPAVREVLAACEAMRQRTDGYFDVKRGDGIDPSGYVKGWAIRGAAQLLEREGVRDYCVEAGGDLQAQGHNSDGQPWKIGIRHPQHRHQIVKVLHMTDGAVATSGNYERGEHIYDPHTGRPATGLASVTVVGSDIIWADVAATAAFAMGAAGAGWLAQKGLECYVIGHDGKATFTPGLREYL